MNENNGSNRTPGMGISRRQGVHRRMDSGRMQRHTHDQSVFHTLLERHRELQREVENLPNGIRSVTTSQSPDLVALLREHAHAMHQRLQEGFGLRYWDAAFAEIFARADSVRMQINNLPDGVETIETSDDPNVIKLIQAHGQVVNAFVTEGFDAARRVSPLPDDYRRALS